MFGRTWRIARIGGFDITVDSSWVFLGLLIVFNWFSIFDDANVKTGTAVTLAVLAAVIFFGSILAHELAHALVARLRHISVIGITLHLFGGFTAHRGERRPLDTLLISAAGPLTSLAVGFGLIAASKAGGLSAPLSFELNRLGGLNVFLAVVNSLPGYPMDGGQVLRAIVWGVTGNRDRATVIAAILGQVVGAAAVALGLWQFAQQGIDRSFYSGWLLIVGIFIFSGARQALAQSRSRQALAAGTADEAMSPLGPPMAEDLSLSESLDRHFREHRGGVVPVVDQSGKLVGILTFEAARRVGSHDPLRPVRDAMIQPADVAIVQADEHLDRVAERLGEGETVVVLRDGQLIGTITPSDLGRWLGSRARR